MTARDCWIDFHRLPTHEIRFRWHRVETDMCREDDTRRGTKRNKQNDTKQRENKMGRTRRGELNE